MYMISAWQPLTRTTRTAPACASSSTCKLLRVSHSSPDGPCNVVCRPWTCAAHPPTPLFSPPAYALRCSTSTGPSTRPHTLGDTITSNKTSDWIDSYPMPVVAHGLSAGQRPPNCRFGHMASISATHDRSPCSTTWVPSSHDWHCLNATHFLLLPAPLSLHTHLQLRVCNAADIVQRHA